MFKFKLMIVALELVHSGEVNHLFVIVLMIVSLVIFYISIMANHVYYKENIKLTKKDIIEMIVVSIIGIAIMLMFIDNLYAFLIGSLIITLGNLKILPMKLKGV